MKGVGQPCAAGLPSAVSCAGGLGVRARSCISVRRTPCGSCPVGCSAILIGAGAGPAAGLGTVGGSVPVLLTATTSDALLSPACSAGDGVGAVIACGLS